MSGYGSGSGYMPFTKEMADSWTKECRTRTAAPALLDT